jgi:hypothetical protein
MTALPRRLGYQPQRVDARWVPTISTLRPVFTPPRSSALVPDPLPYALGLRTPVTAADCSGLARSVKRGRNTTHKPLVDSDAASVFHQSVPAETIWS